MEDTRERNGPVPPAPGGSDADLLEYGRIVWRRRRLLLSIVGAFLLLAIVKTFLTPPSYAARTLLDVEKEIPGEMDFRQTSVYAMWDPEFYQTQYDLLQSRGLAERVVTTLKLADRPDFNPAKSSFWKPRAGKPANAAMPVDEDLRASLAMKVQGMTSIQPARGTHLVSVQVVAGSPRLAADIANGLAESFIGWNMERKFKQASEASRFLATEAEQLKSELDEKKRQLAAYGATSNIVSSDPQGNLTMQKLESISKDYGTALADRISKESKYSEVRTAPPEAVADTLSNGLVTQLRAEQSKLEREYAQKLNIFKPEWPAMQQLAAQIQKGKEHLNGVVEETVKKARETARADYEAALQREQSLQAVLGQQKRQAVAQSSESAEYNNLRLDVQVRQTLLDSLLKRQSETSIDSRLSGQKGSNVRVVDGAIVPKTRFRPSYSRNVLLAGFLGMALGLGAIFLLDHLDRSLKTAEDVEHWVNLPTLGVIPAIGESTGRGYGYGLTAIRGKSAPEAASRTAGDQRVELIPVDKPQSAAAEAYRAVRTALLLSSADRLQVVVVTSAVPGEGKTATSVNLAVVLAQLGKKVLLVDADLRKPCVHEVFRLSRRAGLVSYLAGQAGIDEIAVDTGVPNLSVIGAGPNPPNPSELLSSSRMASFLEAVRAAYDYVIIDTPPVLPVTDAVIAGKHADGAILCIYAGKTARELVRKASERLQQAGVNVYGGLLNNLAARFVGGAYYGKTGHPAEYAAYFSEAGPDGRKDASARGSAV
jgi:succinoglycan biosynthesis transport protein ExoP